MAIPYYHVDAFTGEFFAGNPAGVCILSAFLADSVMQKIAAENRQPDPPRRGNRATSLPAPLSNPGLVKGRLASHMVGVVWRETPFQSCLGPERRSTRRCGCGSEPATRCASAARAHRRMPRSRARIGLPRLWV